MITEIATSRVQARPARAAARAAACHAATGERESRPRVACRPQCAGRAVIAARPRGAQFQEGASHLLRAAAARQGLAVHVVSVNWSRDLIRAAIQCNPLLVTPSSLGAGPRAAGRTLDIAPPPPPPPPSY